MTAHELARELLKQPDHPVLINGWGSDEGFTFEVSRVDSAEGFVSLNYLEGQKGIEWQEHESKRQLK